MPLGAIIARESIMDWEPGAHGSTFGGNPVSCAAALATPRLIENGYMQNAAEMGDYLMDKVREMKARHKIISSVRGLGLMIGIEIEYEGYSGHDLRDRIVEVAFPKGLLLLGAGDNVIRLMPPLMIDRATSDEALAIFEESIDEIEAAL